MTWVILIILTIWVMVMPLFKIIRWPNDYPKWKCTVINLTYTFWGILMVTTQMIGPVTLIITMFAMWLAVRLMGRYLPVKWESYSKFRQFIYCGSYVLWGFCLGNIGSTLNLF